MPAKGQVNNPKSSERSGRTIAQPSTRPWTSENQRTRGYTGFIHFYNHHRSHGLLKWATPISILQDNLSVDHT